MRLELYKILHLVGVISLVASLSAVYLSDKKSALANMLLGLSSIMILIAGFGLLHLTGSSMHSHWIAGKMAIWAVIAIGAPIVAKRKPELKTPFYAVAMLLLVVAAGLAVLKP